jgi:POT family proton-dependent oligopeptide transporter
MPVSLSAKTTLGTWLSDLAAIVMTISLLTFVFTQKNLGPIGLSPFAGLNDGKSRKWYEYAVYVGSLLVIPVIMKMVAKTEYTDYFMYTIGPCTLIYLYSMKCSNFRQKNEKSYWLHWYLSLFSILFWAFFEQSGGSLSLFAANNLDNQLLGIKLDPNGVNNAANSLFVIIFSPLLGLLWIAMSNKKSEPNTVVKFGLGFLFLAAAFYTFYSTRFFANEQGITSLDLFTFAYLIITFGELCLSPIGLSIMTKLSPKPLQGVMMGMWFLASAYGQYVAGILGAGMAKTVGSVTAAEKLITYTDGYKQLAIYALICGLVLIMISPLVRRLMGTVK